MCQRLLYHLPSLTTASVITAITQLIDPTDGSGNLDFKFGLSSAELTEAHSTVIGTFGGGSWDPELQDYIRVSDDGIRSVSPFKSIPHAFWFETTDSAWNGQRAIS